MSVPSQRLGFVGGETHSSTEPVLKNWLTIEGSAKTHNHTRAALQERAGKRVTEKMIGSRINTDFSTFATSCTVAIRGLSPAISRAVIFTDGGSPFSTKGKENENSPLRS